MAHGRSHIVAAWLENRDAAGTYRGAYRPLLVKDDLAIAVGMSFYTARNSIKHRLYFSFEPASICLSGQLWLLQHFAERCNKH